MNTIYEVVGPDKKTVATFVFRNDAEYYIIHEYPLGRIVEKTYILKTKRIKNEIHSCGTATSRKKGLGA